jgi:pimeloyl-ACP methyl ester carboxylesterase
MKEKKIDIGGLPVNYKTFGEGKPVLILHGWGGKSDSWLCVGELLAENGFQVIVPDLPGFGKSQEPKNPWTIEDYLRFVESFVGGLEIRQFYLIGHSMGGGLSVMYAVNNRLAVQGLVLCDSAVIRKERLDCRQSCAKKMALAKKLFVKMPILKKILPFGQKMVYKIAGVQDYHLASPVMKETFGNIIKADLQKYAAQVVVPTLIIWGGRDKNTPIEDAYTLQHLIPGAILKVIEEAGHNPHRQAPERLVEILLGFIKNK